MRYEYAFDIQRKAENICKVLFSHINIERIKCFRGYGSSTRNTLARCHALGKIMQKALGVRAFYVLEFLAEKFDKLESEEQTKIIIHELMHIPKAFGGGFKHHNFVTEKNVAKYYEEYKLKTKDEILF
jgi:predicted metallopeptidase